MKKTMKSILSGVVFLLGLLALLAGLSRLLEYKGSREKNHAVHAEGGSG